MTNWIKINDLLNVAVFSLLREARQQLCSDQKDKAEAQGIDQSCHGMNNSSSMISYKPNPTRVLKE